MRKYCTRKLPLYFFVYLFGNYIPAIGFDFEFSFYLLLHMYSMLIKIKKDWHKMFFENRPE